MNFDLFCKKNEKKCKTAITFAYDVEKKSLIYQKKLEKNWDSISGFLDVLGFRLGFRFPSLGLGFRV
jgi:hypothetical protein